jgi:hypothetical protein
MSTSRAKRRTVAIVPKYVDHATAERFLSVEEHAKKLEQRDIQRQEMWVGQKGEGKTVGMVQRLANLLNHPDEQQKSPKPQSILTSHGINLNNLQNIRPVSASGYGGGGYSSGSGGSNNINYQPTTNQYPNWGQQQQAPYYYQWDTTPNSYPISSAPQQTPQKEEPKKQEFKPEDYKGKFCAIVTLEHHGKEHRGVLFVKKCGHWKLCGYNGGKLAGGTSGSFETELKAGTLKITVHQTIYTDAPPETSENDLEIF